MKFCLSGLILAVLLINPLCFAVAAEEIDFAPLFQKGKDIYGNERWRALGPLLESKRSEKGDDLFTFRPFYSYIFYSTENFYRRQALYPVYMAKCNDTEWDMHFLLLFSYQDFDINDPESRYRLWLFPLYFQGRDIDGVPYLAIFPLAGGVREFFIFDELRFALFPFTFYYRINDVETLSLLWPIMSRATGGGNDRLRVFPLFGYSKLREESVKYFILWPFWAHARYAPPQSPGYGYIIFPFYGRVNLENQKSTMIVPPLFRYAHRGDATMIHCPWPFFQYRSGPMKKLYLWPLMGRSSRGTTKSSFLLWPLCLHYEHKAPFYEYNRFMVFPIFYSTSTRGSFDKPGRKMDQPRKTIKFWPLFSCVTDTDRSRFAMLSLFPYRDYDAIERNYGALWTIFTYSSFKDNREAEFFWGLVRFRESERERRFSLFPLVSVGRERKSGEFHWSFLKGLIAREKAGGKRSFRLLYFIKF